MMSTLKLFAAATMLAGVAMATTPASATGLAGLTKSAAIAQPNDSLTNVGKKFKFGKFHRKFHVWHHKPHFYHGGGCGFFYKKWKFTGKYYWKKRYFMCKGW